jgi:ABC-type multidrug transport system ATPase subunit
MDFAVETRDLTRTFGTFRAVDGIDLAVPTGSFYGFLGPNGAGKSTTIKCLTGLLRPSAGSMRILGLDPLADPVGVKRRTGVVPEDLALFERLSGEEMLAFVAQVHGIDRATARRRTADLLGVMDLASAGSGLVADYSHGMRKKLALAMTPMCVESRSTISRMWEVRKIVPPRATNPWSRSLICREATASIPSNGSSRKSSRGAGSSATASASFLRMPW